jgi:hypothetical protein
MTASSQTRPEIHRMRNGPFPMRPDHIETNSKPNILIRSSTRIRSQSYAL